MLARRPRVSSGYAAPVLVGASVVTAVLFVVSVLVATRRTLSSPAVTASQARRPGGESRTAVAGPPASLVTGALLGLAAWTAAGAGAPLLVDALTHLVALNVVPALADRPAATPVEGGRILRAALLAAGWTRTVP